MSTRIQISDRIEKPGVRLDRHSSSHTIIWLSFVIGIGLLLRTAALGTRSFWLDEAASSMLARVDWNTFTTAVAHRQANMIFYYLLLRGWFQFGSGESWARLLSVLLGVAAIPVMYQLGKLMLGAKGGRTAALLLAVHAFHIEYSQEARGYSLSVLLALFSCYFFLKLVDSPAWRASIAYAAATVLMIFTQVLGALLFLTQWLHAFSCWDTSKPKKRALWIFIAIAALAAPLGFILFFKSDRSQLAWMNQSSASTLHNVLLSFSGNAGTSLLILEMALVVASALFRFRKSSSRSSPGYTFLWLWVVLPVVLLGVVNLRWSVLQARYLIVCLPAFLLLVADGLSQIKSRVVFTAACMAVVGLSIIGVSSYFLSRTDLSHSDNWRDASRYILSAAQPGDVVLFSYSAEEIAFREYQNRFAARQPLIVVPQQTDLELLSTAGRWTLPQAAESAASLHSRVWMISALQPNSRSRDVEAAVESRLREQMRRRFGFVTVQLFTDADVQMPAAR